VKEPVTHFVNKPGEYELVVDYRSYLSEHYRRIGKESDRRWEEGDDLESLMYVPMEYVQPGEQAEDPSLARASERLIRTIKDIGIRELVRFGLARRIRGGRRILEKICRRELLDRSTLCEYDRMVRAYKLKAKRA
jgi:hypothetical protein